MGFFFSILVFHSAPCVFQQSEIKLDAESWDPQSTSQMATAPVSTPSRSWCVPVSVSQPTCFKIGSVAPTAGSSGLAGTATRTGGASTTRPAPSASSYSVRTAARERTRSPWSPRASARGTRGSTMNRATSSRSWVCRHLSSCTSTSQRARGGWARIGWGRTGTKQNPESRQTHGLNPHKLKGVLSLWYWDKASRAGSRGLSLSVTGTLFMWSWFLTMMENSKGHTEDFS